MAAGKPFTRRGITFVSQYAYRQFLAAERGFASPAARRKAIAEAHKVVETHLPGSFTPEQRGVLAAGIADYKHRIGSYVEGIAPDQRGSTRLPDYLLALIRSTGDEQYRIWRTLYI